MSDLIKRSDAIEWLKEVRKAGDIDPYTSNQRKCDFEEAINCIEEIPTAAPKRGEWLWDDGYFCSECRVEAIKFPLDTEAPMYLKTAFCPNCGADLRGRHNE